MNDLELERYLRTLDRAGLIDPEDKEPEGWAEFVKTMLQDVNSGNMDTFVFILMKMLADYKKACDQTGRTLPNPAAGSGMARVEGDDAEDTAALATGVTEPVVMNELDSITQDDVRKRLVTPDHPFGKVWGNGEAYFTYGARKYSKIKAEGRYFVYPDSGSFRLLRGHIVKIHKINKSRMDVTILTGPAADPKTRYYERFHETTFPLTLLPKSYFEGQS